MFDALLVFCASQFFINQRGPLSFTPLYPQREIYRDFLIKDMMYYWKEHSSVRCFNSVITHQACLEMSFFFYDSFEAEPCFQLFHTGLMEYKLSTAVKRTTCACGPHCSSNVCVCNINQCQTVTTWWCHATIHVACIISCFRPNGYAFHLIKQASALTCCGGFLFFNFINSLEAFPDPLLTWLQIWAEQSL